MIRLATIADAPALVALADEFLASGAYWGSERALDAGTFYDHVCKLIASPIVAVFVAEDISGNLLGAIAAILAPDIFSGELIAMKMHWIAQGGIGLRLEKKAIEWARERGATAFKMSAINDDSAQLLERLGYNRTEIIYSKVI
jgi:hypothetical protein